jgi:hypothetical protein
MDVTFGMMLHADRGPPVFGMMLHIDRGPAAAVPPPVQTPVIEAVVVSPVQATVSPTEPSSRGQFCNTHSSPNSRLVLTYDIHGKGQTSSGFSGSNLDLFA